MDEYQELYHYGIKGMRWGVRRAKKAFSSSSSDEGRAKQVSKLTSIRNKGQKQVDKLSKATPKLQNKVDKMVSKNDTKERQLREKSAKLRNKKYSFWTSEEKASQLDASANFLKAKSDRAKAMLTANEHMINMFKNEISGIDEFLIQNGKKYLS